MTPVRKNAHSTNASLSDTVMKVGGSGFAIAVQWSSCSDWAPQCQNSPCRKKKIGIVLGQVHCCAPYKLYTYTTSDQCNSGSIQSLKCIQLFSRHLYPFGITGLWYIEWTGNLSRVYSRLLPDGQRQSNKLSELIAWAFAKSCQNNSQNIFSSKKTPALVHT